MRHVGRSDENSEDEEETRPYKVRHEAEGLLTKQSTEAVHKLFQEHKLPLKDPDSGYNWGTEDGEFYFNIDSIDEFRVHLRPSTRAAIEQNDDKIGELVQGSFGDEVDWLKENESVEEGNDFDDPDPNADIEIGGYTVKEFGDKYGLPEDWGDILEYGGAGSNTEYYLKHELNDEDNGER